MQKKICKKNPAPTPTPTTPTQPLRYAAKGIQKKVEKGTIYNVVV
jgi:hypothetical protein